MTRNDDHLLSRPMRWRAAASLLLLLLLATLASIPAGASAETGASAVAVQDVKDLDLPSLLETVVEVGTSSRPQMLREVPAVVEVLTAEEIERLGVRDLRELVAHFVGTYQHYNPAEPFFQRAAHLRGGPTANRFLVLLDDRILPGGVTQHHEEFAVPMDAIARVELLRGPAAVLYGTNAMAGVIRLVTRASQQDVAAGTARAETRLVGEVIHRVGEVSGSVGASPLLLAERLQVRADAQVRETEDTRLRVDTGTAGIRVQPHKTRAVSTLLALRRGETSTRLLLHELQSVMMGLEPTARWDAGWSRSRLLSMDARHRVATTRCSLDASAALDLRNLLVDIGAYPAVTSGPPTEVTANVRTVQLHTSGACAASHLGDISFGLAYRHTKHWNFSFDDKTTGEANPLGPARGLVFRSHDADIFMQGELRPLPSLRLVGGGRLNLLRHTAENLATVPDDAAQRPLGVYPMARLGVVWLLTNTTTLKVLYGRALRVPGPQELYPDVAPVIVPNPALRPEAQDTVELALDLAAGNGLTVRANGFVNAFSDAIVGDIARNHRFTNSDDEFATYGVQGRLQWQAGRTSVELGGTAQKCHSDAGCQHRPIPRLLTQAVASWQVPWLTGMQATSRVHGRSGFDAIDATVDVDVGIVWTVTDAVRVTCTGRNLLGSRAQAYYSEALLIGELRRTRSLRLGLVLSI